MVETLRDRLKVILFPQSDIPGRAEKMGIKLRKQLHELQEKYPKIGDVRGLGPMLAMEFVKDPKTKKPDAETSSNIMKECLKNGLMTLKAGLYSNAIRLHPPLIIEDDLLETGMGILEAAVKKYA